MSPWVAGPISPAIRKYIQMRFVPYPYDPEDDEECRSAADQHEPDKMVCAVDWKVYADEVLQNVDEQLAAFGLEVIQYETGSDYYEWHIERRIPRSAREAAAEAIWSEQKARNEEEAEQFVWGVLGWSRKDPDSRKEDDLELWREERRKQIAAHKTEGGGDGGITGPGVPRTRLH